MDGVTEGEAGEDPPDDATGEEMASNTVPPPQEPPPAAPTRREKKRRSRRKGGGGGGGSAAADTVFTAPLSSSASPPVCASPPSTSPAAAPSGVAVAAAINTAEMRAVLVDRIRELEKQSLSPAVMAIPPPPGDGRLRERYMTELQERQRLEREVVTLRRQLENALREKQAYIAELRVSSTKTEKLEALCRDLQRFQRSAMEETTRALHQEEDARREQVESFKSSIADLNVKVAEQQQRYQLSTRENDLLRQQLMRVQEQLEMHQRVASLQLQTRSKELELKNGEIGRLEERVGELTSESDVMHVKVGQLVDINRELKDRVQLYEANFTQTAATMERVKNDIGRVSKENEMLRGRLAGEGSKQQRLSRAVERLKSLSQQLQAERDEARRELSTVTGAGSVPQPQPGEDAPS